MKRSIRHRATFATVALLSAAVLAACSSDDPGQDSTADGELIPLTVANFPSTGLAQIQLAIDEGFFEDHGLDVTLQVAESGAAIIPGTIAGDIQIGYANVVSSLIAYDNDLPITLIQDFAIIPEDPEQDISQVFVREDSGITDASGLVGANIAVNGLQNIGEVTIRVALENRGVDTSGLTFTQLGFPDMNDALDRGDVDAIWVVEPFVTSARAAGYVPVLSNFAEATPGSRGGGHYFVTRDYAADNPEIISAFQAAITEAGAFANENPDALRAQVVDVLGVPETVADVIELGSAPEDPGVTVADLDIYIDAVIDQGIISAAPDLDEYVHEGSRR